MIPLEEQIARKCIHFNGVMNKKCKAGIKYEDIREEPESGPYKFPCLKQGGQCDHSKFLTEQEVKDKIKAIDEQVEKTINALVSVNKHYTDTKESTGKIKCQCGGELNYVRAEVNGHFWVKCNSCGISFNE